MPPFHLDNIVPNVDITPAVILTKKNINVNKSSGPDGLQGSIKETLQLSIPLCILFKKSLSSSSCLPSCWKHAQFTRREIVLLISANNYRPISLTSPIVQILE